MAFCEGGFAKVKDFMHKIDGVLEQTLVDVTTITGKIKAIEGDPTVEQLVAIIPNGSAYEAVFNSAVDKVATGLQAGIPLAQKILALIEGLLPDARDAALIKLASVATAIKDARYPQHFYDTAAQVHIEGLK